MTGGMFECMGGNPVPRTPRKRIFNPEQLDITLFYVCSLASDAVTETVTKVDEELHSRQIIKSNLKLFKLST